MAWPRSARTPLAEGHRVNTFCETATHLGDGSQEYNAGEEPGEVIRVESLGAEGRPFLLTKFSRTSSTCLLVSLSMFSSISRNKSLWVDIGSFTKII